MTSYEIRRTTFLKVYASFCMVFRVCVFVALLLEKKKEKKCKNGCDVMSCPLKCRINQLCMWIDHVIYPLSVIGVTRIARANKSTLAGTKWNLFKCSILSLSKISQLIHKLCDSFKVKRRPMPVKQHNKVTGGEAKKPLCQKKIY